MRQYNHLTEGILRPEEMNALQKIFDGVIAQPWFDLNDYSRETFAARLIQLYRSGIVDLGRLEEVSMLTAKAHFSRGTMAEKRKALERLLEVECDDDRSSADANGGGGD